MKRLFVALVVLLCFTFQTSFSDLFIVWGIRPDLLLVCVVWFSLGLSPFSASLLGFLCGLSEDAVSSFRLGTNGFSKALIALIISLLGRKVYPTHIELQFLLIFFATLANGIILSLFLLFEGRWLGISYHIFQGVYNGILAALFTLLIRRLL